MNGMNVAAMASQTTPALSDDIKQLIDRALKMEKWPIARLISMVEVESDSAAEQRHVILDYLDSVVEEANRDALVVGITGTPGAGKSTLIGELCLRMLQGSDDLFVAVIAIDPSSQRSGGALLGDRTRVKFPSKDKRLFFRSQASHQELGGLGKKTYHAVRLLRYIFDIVVIETVGIGQSELEIDRLSDLTCLVLQPLTGDQVQFMKAGIMEIPDLFIVNKCDEDALAKKSYHLLRASLKLIDISTEQDSDRARPVFMTSALKNKGIEELARHILSLRQDPESFKNREIQGEYYLCKWIRQNYGGYGIEVYQSIKQNSTSERFSFEDREKAFNRMIKGMVKPLESFPCR